MIRRKFRRLAVLVCKPVSFVVATASIWFVCVKLSQAASFLVVSLYTGGHETARIPLLIPALLHYVAAVSLAFYIATVFHLFSPLRRTVELLRTYTVPPYHTIKRRHPSSLVTTKAFRASNQRMVLVACSMFVFAGVYTTIVIQFGYHQAPQYVEETLQLGDAKYSIYLIPALSYLLSMPFGTVGPQVTRRMNSYSLAANLVFLWVPTALLSLGYYNLIARLHGAVKTWLYLLILFAVHKVRAQ